MRFGVLSTLLAVLGIASASRVLHADALVPCMNSNGVTSSKFNITYDHEKREVYYDASVNVAFGGKVYADADLYIYGLKAIHVQIDPCSENNRLKELCPLTAGEIDIQGSSQLSEDITKHIPGIAFTVPDLDAYLIAKVYADNDPSNLLACLRVEVKNSKTVEQTAVKWVTAVLSGVGLLVSSLLVVYAGTSVNAQSISAVTVLMLNYFQSMAFLDMESVERVPPIASAWSENIAWSVGLVYTKFMQKIFRWYVQATGGSPATYLEYPTKPVLVQRIKRRAVEAASTVSDEMTSRFIDGVMSVVPPRVQDWYNQLHKGVMTPAGERVEVLARNLVRRDNAAASESFAKSSKNLVVYRGIERISYKMGIEVTNAVLTSYTIFIFICVCVVFVFAVLILIVNLATRKSRRTEPDAQALEHSSTEKYPVDGDAESTTASASVQSFHSYRSRGSYFHALLPVMLKGTLLKLWYVAFPPVMVFSMWEWTHRDSAAVIVTSVFMFLICLVLCLFNVFRMFLIARKSERQTGTPAFLLYGDEKTLQKYGYLYSMFNSKFYYFGFVYLVYNFVKACFLAFSQASGKTQALAIFIIELAMFIVVAVYKPFLSKAVNAIQITTHVVITLNACFFLFFSNLMTQPLIVNGVMGVIFFVLNAAYSLVLLLYIIIYSVICIIWHPSHGTNRDHDANDDRQSFILEQNTPAMNHAAELHALGAAAQADHATDAEEPTWFDNRQSVDRPIGGTRMQNPFEPSIVPPHLNQYNDSELASNDRTYTMGSEASMPTNMPVGFNEFNPAVGSHSHNMSESSFGLSHSPSNSKLPIETENSAKGRTTRTPRLSKMFRRLKKDGE